MSLPSSAEPALIDRNVLSLEAAQAIIDGCFDRAAKENWDPLAVAVFDDGGNIVSFSRQDVVSVGNVEYAKLKGRTAAIFGYPTTWLSDIEYKNPDRPSGLMGNPSIRPSAHEAMQNGQILGCAKLPTIQGSTAIKG